MAKSSAKKAASPVHVIRNQKAKLELDLSYQGSEPAELLGQEPCDLTLRSKDHELTVPARVRGHLEPKKHCQLRVKMKLPATTPPGEYEGSVKLPDGTAPVRVLVPERRQAVFAPSRILCEVARDGRDSHTVVIENRGNVPIEIRNPLPGVIEPKDRDCRVLRRAMSLGRDNESFGLKDLGDSLARAAVESVAEDTLAGASIDGAPFTLGPGESRAITLQLRLPTPARGLYRTRLYVAGARLSVEIHSNRVGQDEETEG